MLLVDTDPQGNASSGLGINRLESLRCIYDVLINGVPLDSVIVPTELDNLELVPATIQLAGAESELVSAISREVKLRRALAPVKVRYDFILVDALPLGLLTLNALTAADTVLIPLM